MSCPRTLIVGQISQPTGMARVTRAISGRLARSREVHVLGIDAFGPLETPSTDGAAGWTLHPNPHSWDVFAEVTLAELSARLLPQSILLYHDPWIVPRMRNAIVAESSVVAAYCPIDAVILCESIVKDLSSLDGLAVPTRFAREQILRHAISLGLADMSPFDTIAVIPHGVDLAAFTPHGDAVRHAESRRLAARRALFPDRPDLWEGFWVLNANRNQGRKRLDLTLQGFARFAAEAPLDVRLYLHWGAERIGVDVQAIARGLGITDRLLISSEAVGGSTDRLNLVYNATDVGVNTATGEGWGLVSFEHAATGAPQILPAHSACVELWTGAAELLPVRRSLTCAGLIEGGEIDPDGLAAALSRLYRDRTYYMEMSHRAFERARDPSLRWQTIGDSWDTWLCTLEGEHRTRRNASRGAAQAIEPVPQWDAEKLPLEGAGT